MQKMTFENWLSEILIQGTGPKSRPKIVKNSFLQMVQYSKKNQCKYLEPKLCWPKVYLAIISCKLLNFAFCTLVLFSLVTECVSVLVYLIDLMSFEIVADHGLMFEQSRRNVWPNCRAQKTQSKSNLPSWSQTFSSDDVPWRKTGL